MITTYAFKQGIAADIVQTAAYARSGILITVTLLHMVYLMVVMLF